MNSVDSLWIKFLINTVSRLSTRKTVDNFLWITLPRLCVKGRVIHIFDMHMRRRTYALAIICAATCKISAYVRPAPFFAVCFAGIKSKERIYYLSLLFCCSFVIMIVR